MRIPVVYCRGERGDTGVPLWVFYCQYCRLEHVHGAGYGHRVAHCGDVKSPYYETGYILEHESAKPIGMDEYVTVKDPPCA